MQAPDPLLAWVTLHPEKFWDWRSRRQGDPARYAISHKRHRYSGPLDVLRAERWGGSSGLYAVQIAIETFGLDRIVLCGVPMSGEFGHIRGQDHWEGASRYQDGWNKARPFIRNTVRSMSGWTREQYGVPTPDWLIGE